jgi:thioredoxin 1
MKDKIIIGIVVLFALLWVGGAFKFPSSGSGPEAIVQEYGGSVPVKGMVNMIDLGAKSCVPCKMMAPIMEKVEKDYRGRAAIIFIDVWKDQRPAQRFGVRAIPTQIFFDKEGKEVYRHEGFMSEAAIVSQLKKMGVS